MKLIRTEDAVGSVLCHDMTQIIPGVTKDARFRKGHVVTEEDIPVLLSMGKENLYVFELPEGSLHEDEAAERLVAMCLGPHMTRGQAKEGKIEIKADADGLFKVDRRRLALVNGQDQLMIATRMGNAAVKKGDKLAGMRSGNGVSQSFDLSFYDGLQPEGGCGGQFDSCHGTIIP